MTMSGRKRGPRNFSQKELLKVGMEIVNPNTNASCIRCVVCHASGVVMMPPQGTRRHKNYWKCENGCNSTAGV
jgi:hypothetical protein